VEAAARFPWPERSDALVLTAAAESRGWGDSSLLAREAAQRNAEAVAERAVAVLRRRWPRARSLCPARAPGDAILAAARSEGASAIVIGFSGIGALGRLFMGSVSRHVVRGAACPVLVVKRSFSRARRFVLGADGSANARHAAEWMSALPAPPGGRIALVSVIEPMRLPSAGLMPASVRSTLRAEAEEVMAERRAGAEKALGRLVSRLRRAGWPVRGLVWEGVPLNSLIDAAQKERAEVLVIGARGTSGAARVLLGSVAEGAIGHAPMSVLVVR
jgi:nucleotide-binding universal stress UspA family protein